MKKIRLDHKPTGKQIALIMKAYRTTPHKKLADKLNLSTQKLRKKFSLMAFTKREIEIIEHNYKLTDSELQGL